MGGLVAALAAVVAVIWLRWPGQTLPPEPPGDLRPSARGWKIRYNANVSLAAIGSDKVRLDLLREMLDENQQLVNFRVKLQNGKDVPDENGARSAILTTLRAITEWHKKRDVRQAYRADRDKLDKVYAAIAALAEKSPNPVVQSAAKRTQDAVSAPPG
jgi:hypothetical protein